MKRQKDEIHPRWKRLRNSQQINIQSRSSNSRAGVKREYDLKQLRLRVNKYILEQRKSTNFALHSEKISKDIEKIFNLIKNNDETIKEIKIEPEHGPMIPLLLNKIEHIQNHAKTLFMENVNQTFTKNSEDSDFQIMI